MNGPNNVTYEFNIDPAVDLSGLRVNLYIYGKSTGSSWYSYDKIITVIDKGKVLDKNFKDNTDISYIIEAVDTKRGHYFYYDDPYEHDGLRTDYIRTFIFSDDMVKQITHIIRNQYESDAVYEKNLHYVENKDNKKLEFFHPKISKYHMSQPAQEWLDKEVEIMGFEGLKTGPKIKEKDILRLKNITDAQKQELIKIHSQLKFNDP
ncbi:hypothetical protein [Acinetobacter shaoyimingii]|uniref:Uncharacterized protein n=2 Tax=Acinetobacter shaoyimingii TaxID=2715164 RepID=A0A6G8RT76_9GAMM|nr:hypothetical protein [Acinetobacter shaoyimingii]QIO05077.1 hypothetical protein G8E00_03360 [Acinetobacter shaoyimingii]